jgi:hypothetical protein
MIKTANLFKSSFKLSKLLINNLNRYQIPVQLLSTNANKRFFTVFIWL